MAGRISLETAISALLGLLFLVSGAALIELGNGSSPLEAFTDGAPRAVLGTVGIAFGVWVVLSAIGNTVNRGRSGGWKVLANGVSALILAALNVFVWFAIAVPQGGWALLLVAIVLIMSALFVAAAVLALCLTHLVLLRTPARRPADELAGV